MPEPETNRAPQSSAAAARGLGRKVVVAALAASLVFAALALYGDVRDLRTTARSFEVSAFVVALVLALGNYLLRIVRWQYYLRRIGVSLPLPESSAVFLSGFVMSVTPGKVGEVFKSLLLYESRGVSIARSAPIVVAERLTDLIALVLLISVGSLAFEHGLAVALSSATLVAGLVLVCVYRPLGRLLLSLVNRLPLLRKLAPRLHEAYDSLLEMTRLVPLLVGSGTAFLAWGLECGSLYAIVHGFSGVQIGWDQATFAYSASTMAGAIAMMPGGLGVTEIGMTALLQTLGGPAMRPSIATASTILVRIATLWFAVLLGALALPMHRAIVRRLPRAALGSAARNDA